MNPLPTLLKVEGLKKYFPVRKGLLLRQVGNVKAVDDVSFEIRQGETLGLVGESGCGKSTLGRTIIRIENPSAGQISFQGNDFLTPKGKALQLLRRDMQMIFQDPFAALDPRMTIGQILAEPFLIHKVAKSAELEAKVKNLLNIVGMKPSDMNRYPHEFSGGQKQRICIARAIALEPSFIIADEPVSALDVSIQAQILNLMKELQTKLNLTYLFISHDLSVIEHVCDRIAVMYLGKIVEIASREELFNNPQHPYTRALIAAIPKIGSGKRKIKKSLSGEVPSPINPPSGCYFHPRCDKASDRCSKSAPSLLAQNPAQSGHLVSCWNPDLSSIKSQNQDSILKT